jgi:hypothetical protein
MTVFNLLSFHPAGIGTASLFSNAPQPVIDNSKDNSSSELVAEIPPHVFPKASVEDDVLQRQGEELPPLVFPEASVEDDVLQRQGGELPPSVFPKEFDDKSGAGYDSALVTDKGIITNIDKIPVSIPKQTPVQKVASEVPDLLSSDTYNRTVYEDGTEDPIQNDTVTVTGPNVINNDKTHEEDVVASSMEKKEKENESNNKDVSVTGTSILPSLNSSEGTSGNNQNVTPVHDKHSAITVTESNVASTEKFMQSGNITEVVQRNEKNGTSLDDTFTTLPVTEGNISVKDPKENDSISDKNKEKVKTNSDNRTNKHESTSETESNTTIKDGPMNRIESNTTFTYGPTSRTESNTTIKDEPTSRTGSNTTTNSEMTAKSESLSSTIKELPVTEPTTTQLVQQSTPTTLQPTLKTESTTSVNISENVIPHKAEDTPLALAASQQHADHSHASSGKSSAFLQPTESAAILAGVFVGIALIGYIGLLIWRRVLE